MSEPQFHEEHSKDKPCKVCTPNINPEYVEKAKEIVAELLNPEPHPFQKEWSDEHSMTSETLLNRIASALQQVAEEVRAKTIEEIEKYWKFDNNQQPLSSWHDKQDLIKALNSKESK